MSRPPSPGTGAVDTTRITKYLSQIHSGKIIPISYTSPLILVFLSDDASSPPAPTLLRNYSSGALHSLLSIASSTGVSKTYAAAVDKAAQILPTSLTTSLSSRRRNPEPPPVLIAIRLQSGEDIYLPLPLTITLHELLQRCAEESHVPISTLRITIEEDRPTEPPGLLSAFRYTARSISSRERLREGLVDWINFLFVPEAVNREVRGRGLVSWFRIAILPHLLPPPPPHIAHVAVFLHGGRRGMVELSATATLGRLRDAIESQTGLTAERQRVVIAEQAQEGPVQRIFWTIARVIYVIWSLIMSALLALAKWVALGPERDQTVKLKLQCEGVPAGECGVGPIPGSRPADSLEVRADMTLAQLQHLVQLQRGDNVGLQGLLLTSGTGGGGGSPRVTGKAAIGGNGRKEPESGDSVGAGVREEHGGASKRSP